MRSRWSRTWRVGGVKVGCAVVERKDSVEPDDVQMGIQVQASTESLNARDRAGPCGRKSRAAPVVGRHRLVKDARDGRQHVGPEGHEAPELEWRAGPNRTGKIRASFIQSPITKRARTPLPCSSPHP